MSRQVVMPHSCYKYYFIEKYTSLIGKPLLNSVMANYYSRVQLQLFNIGVTSTKAGFIMRCVCIQHSAKVTQTPMLMQMCHANADAHRVFTRELCCKSTSRPASNSQLVDGKLTDTINMH